MTSKIPRGGIPVNKAQKGQNTRKEYMAHDETLIERNIMIQAILVTRKTVDMIVEDAKQKGLNLDYLHDNMTYNAENGETTYVVRDQSKLNPDVWTYTDMTGSGFLEHWQFAGNTWMNRFTDIVKF